MYENYALGSFFGKFSYFGLYLTPISEEVISNGMAFLVYYD